MTTDAHGRAWILTDCNIVALLWVADERGWWRTVMLLFDEDEHGPGLGEAHAQGQGAAASCATMFVAGQDRLLENDG